MNNPWHLSPRELDVIVAATEGNGALTAKEIGRALFISPKTVDVHWERIMNRMGARTRTEAMLMWDRVNREAVQDLNGCVRCTQCAGRGFVREAA